MHIASTSNSRDHTARNAQSSKLQKSKNSQKKRPWIGSRARLGASRHPSNRPTRSTIVIIWPQVNKILYTRTGTQLTLRNSHLVASNGANQETTKTTTSGAIHLKASATRKARSSRICSSAGRQTSSWTLKTLASRLSDNRMWSTLSSQRRSSR